MQIVRGFHISFRVCRSLPRNDVVSLSGTTKPFVQVYFLSQCAVELSPSAEKKVNTSLTCVEVLCGGICLRASAVDRKKKYRARYHTLALKACEYFNSYFPLLFSSLICRILCEQFCPSYFVYLFRSWRSRFGFVSFAPIFSALIALSRFLFFSSLPSNSVSPFITSGLFCHASIAFQHILCAPTVDEHFPR